MNASAPVLREMGSSALSDALDWVLEATPSDLGTCYI